MASRPRPLPKDPRTGRRKRWIGAEFHEPLGHFMLVFNELELRFSWLILGLAPPGPTAEEITKLARRTISDRIELFQKLAYGRFRRNARLKQRISRLLTRMKDVTNYRHALVHGEWRSLGSPATIVHFDIRKNAWTPMTVTPVDIERAARRIRALRTSVHLFHGYVERRKRANAAAARRRQAVNTKPTGL